MVFGHDVLGIEGFEIIKKNWEKFVKVGENLRKVGGLLAKTAYFLKKILTIWGVFFFGPKKWWISEKDFRSRNVLNNARGAEVQGHKVRADDWWLRRRFDWSWSNEFLVVCCKSNGTCLGGVWGIRSNNGYLAEFFFILFKLFFTMSDKYSIADIENAGFGDEILK